MLTRSREIGWSDEVIFGRLQDSCQHPLEPRENIGDLDREFIGPCRGRWAQTRALREGTPVNQRLLRSFRDWLSLWFTAQICPLRDVTVVVDQRRKWLAGLPSQMLLT